MYLRATDFCILFSCPDTSLRLSFLARPSQALALSCCFGGSLMAPVTPLWRIPADHDRSVSKAFSNWKNHSKHLKPAELPLKILEFILILWMISATSSASGSRSSSGCLQPRDGSRLSEGSQTEFRKISWVPMFKLDAKAFTCEIQQEEESGERAPAKECTPAPSWDSYSDHGHWLSSPRPA